jgi:hypothetical protein
MGRRSRKRATAPELREPSPPTAPGTVRTGRRARADEAPAPIWAPFPLVELAILLGIVFVVAGLIWGGNQGRTLLGCGIAVVCLASLEVAIREHFAGFRSHSLLLALLPMAATLGLLFVVIDLPGTSDTRYVLSLGIAVAVFVISFLALREVFRRRSGGLSFRA